MANVLPYSIASNPPRVTYVLQKDLSQSPKIAAATTSKDFFKSPKEEATFLQTKSTVNAAYDLVQWISSLPQTASGRTNQFATQYWDEINLLMGISSFWNSDYLRYTIEDFNHMLTVVSGLNVVQKIQNYRGSHHAVFYTMNLNAAPASLRDEITDMAQKMICIYNYTAFHRIECSGQECSEPKIIDWSGCTGAGIALATGIYADGISYAEYLTSPQLKSQLNSLVDSQ